MNDEKLVRGKSKTLQEIYEEDYALAKEAEVQKSQNWGEENCCTFEKGYYRQPIYSCLDCAEKSGHEVGVCYGCYLKCHLDHETEEVFHKRHFRCDCGTPRSGFKCEITNANKDVDNTENKYSKNFKAIYCWCDDGYDPEYQFMFGCVMCENWFHRECLEQKEGPDGSVASILEPITKSVPADFVCEDCFTNAPFLAYYIDARVTAENLEEYKKEMQEKAASKAQNEQNNNISNNTNNSNNNISSKSCKLKDLQAQGEPLQDPNVHNTFWKVGWRYHLCDCNECLELYKGLGVEYLMDEKDLADEIEEGQEEDEEEAEEEEEQVEEDVAEQPAKKRKSQEVTLSGKTAYEILEERFLSSDQITVENKNNAISGLKDFTRMLEEFLKPKLASGGEVTAEDIAAFKEHLGLKTPRT